MRNDNPYETFERHGDDATPDGLPRRIAKEMASIAELDERRMDFIESAMSVAAKNAKVAAAQANLVRVALIANEGQLHVSDIAQILQTLDGIGRTHATMNDAYEAIGNLGCSA